MNQAELLLDKEINILIRNAKTALSEAGYPSETIEAAAECLITEPEIRMLNARGELTDSGRWAESLQNAIRAKKDLKKGDISQAEAKFREAENWAIRATTADHVNRGYDVLQGSKDAGNAKAEPYRQKWPQYQEYIDELFQKNSRLSYAGMQKKAATKFGCSTKTIQRNTTNPRKE